MKIALLPLALLLLGASAAQAQKLTLNQVPPAVQVIFKAKFPAVKKAAWEKEGADYEAGFKLNGKEMSVVISATGELRETETDMDVAALPAAVRATLARDYKTYKVKEAATIVKADGRTVYEAEISKDGKEQDVLFSAEGKVVPQ